MDLSTFFTALLAIVYFLTSWSADSFPRGTDASNRENVTAKWHVDLHPVIGGTPALHVFGGDYEIKGGQQKSLWFTNNNTIVATFVIREDEPKLSKRNSVDGSSSMRLRAIFLDAANGNLAATSTWPTESRLSRIIAAHDGNFVTQTGSDLTRYSSDLKEEQTLKLPSTVETRWAAHSSPSGKNILFTATNLRTTSAVPWIWVDTVSLSIVRSWEEIQSGWVGISDHNIAMTTCVWVYNCEPDIKARRIDANWKTIASGNRHNHPRPQFVDDDTLVLLGSSTRLIRADGQAVFADDKPFERCWWGEAIPSSGGRRFVVPSCKLTGRVAALDIGGYDELKKIVVYDAPFKGASYSLDVQGPRLKEMTLLAVSPDGLQLAILNGELIALFQLPPLAQ